MASADFASMLANADFTLPATSMPQDKTATAPTSSQQNASPQTPPQDPGYLNLPEDGTPSLASLRHGGRIDSIVDKLSTSDVTPENQKQVQEFAEKSGVTGPVAMYVDTLDKSPEPKMQMMINSEGKPAVMMNEAAHQWTPSYVDGNRKETGEHLSERVNNGSYSKLTPSNLPPEVSADLENISAKMGNTGDKAPDFYVDKSDTRITTEAYSAKTTEGKNVIVINQAAYDELKDGKIPHAIPESNIWHEEAHLARNDNASEKLAAEHNMPGLHKQKEIGADKLAFGPNGSGDPGAFIKQLEIDRTLAYQDFKKNNPNGTEEQFNKEYSDPDHPTFAERKAYLEAMIKSQSGGKDATAHEAALPAKPMHSLSVPSQSQSAPTPPR